MTPASRQPDSDRPPLPRRAIPRAVALNVALALALAAAGFLAPACVDAAPWREVLVKDRAAESAERNDGPPQYVSGMLERERVRLASNLRRALLALAAGCLAAAAWKASRRGRDALEARLGALAGPLLGGVFAVLLQLGDQTRLAIEGARDGLLTEDEAARRLRYFDAAVEPARIFNAIVPADASVVVIDMDFADPQIVKKFGYLVYPRRIFMPPRTEFRFSAADARDILQRMPHGIDWCFDAGYTHLLDLATLVRSRDPAAIVDLRELPR